ncbi:MAG: hypothetical protein ACLPYB_16270 [Desulfobaccales bacterium]
MGVQAAAGGGHGIGWRQGSGRQLFSARYFFTRSCTCSVSFRDSGP